MEKNTFLGQPYYIVYFRLHYLRHTYDWATLTVLYLYMNVSLYYIFLPKKKTIVENQSGK